MTVKQFLEKLWKSYNEFVIVKNGCQYLVNVLDIAMFIEYSEFLNSEIDRIKIESNLLYIYCC